MAFKPGHKKYGGRKKGTPNKKTADAQKMADEMGVDPLKILLHFAAGDHKALGYKSAIPMDLRLGAAKDACSYLYAKRKAVEISAESDPLPVRNFAFPDPKETE